MTTVGSTIYLRDTQQGDVISIRGTVSRVKHIASAAGIVTLHKQQLNEKDEWVMDAYAGQWPFDLRCRLLHRELASSAREPELSRRALELFYRGDEAALMALLQEAVRR